MSALLESRDAASSLAASVRTLAAEAHRLLGDPDADPADLDATARRIGRLEDRIAARPCCELARWAANLRRMLEARAR